MEEKIFPSPAVAGILEPGFVEARLHTDGPPREEENKARQKEMTESYATPIYVIVDPSGGRVLRLRAGWMSEAQFAGFLRGD